MNRFTRMLMITITAMIVGTSSGCRNRPGDNGSDPTSANTSAELTSFQKTMIDNAIAQVDAAARAFAGTLDGIDDLQSLSLDSQTTCPSLDLTFEPDNGTTIVVDFPDGCTNPLYGESPVTGTVTMTLSLATSSLEVTFADLTVDDQTSNGSLSADYTRQDSTNTLVGNIDLTTSGVGTVNGTITLVIDVAAGTITLEEASLNLNPQVGDAFSITTTALVIVPATNGNFVPQAGTVAFEVPSDAPGPDTIMIVVTFDDQSPVDRTVQVSVGDAPPVDYTLPGGM